MRPLIVASAIASIIAVPAAASVAQSNGTAVAPAASTAPASRLSPAGGPTDSAGAVVVLEAPGDSTAVMRTAYRNLSQRTDDSTQYGNIVGALRVQSVADGAGYVELEDGTRWKVALGDRPRVGQWRAGDYVVVRLAPIAEGKDYRYRLVNGRDESDILVAFRGLAPEPAD